MFTVKLEGFDEAMKMFDPKVAHRAAQVTLNEAARAGRTSAAKEIVGRWNLPKRRVDAEVKNAHFARVDNLTAVIQAKGREIGLSHYGARQVSRTVKTAKGKGRVVRGVSLQILRGVKMSYPRAFMATMASGHLGVFMNQADFFRTDYLYHTPRRGKYAGQRGRSKIVNMATISIASMFQQPRVQDATVRAAVAKWQERFGYHLDRLSR